jgi:phage tail-like protein
MTAETQRSYRFATEAQWNACLFAQVDDTGVATGGGVQPSAPFGRPPTLYAGAAAYAPAITRADEIVFVDHEHSLNRLETDDDQLLTDPAPSPIARATRIIAASNSLWVTGQSPDALQSYETDTLTRLLTVELPHGRVIDIAGDGCDAILALVESTGGLQAIRVDGGGHVVGAIAFGGASHATSFVYLQRSQRFVVLAGDQHQRLYWFAATGERPLFSIAVAAMHPCFVAVALGSDSLDRVLVVGADGDADGSGAFVLVFDADGISVDELPLDPLDAPATGAVGTHDTVLVTGRRGLLRFDKTNVVPDGANQSRCTLVTPVLSSPDPQDGRRWLRIDALAQLPEGSTLEIAFAATDDPATLARVNAIAADPSVPSSRRIAAILGEPDVWRDTTVFHGAAPSPNTPTIYAAKLFDVQEQYIWVCITLSATVGVQLPVLMGLDVLYPGLTLMANLPAVFQRDEARPGSFLRSLVGILEATTQDLDARIGSMGSRINPSTAPGPWLDFIARWLGVPWDDGLSDAQKRAIVTRAPELAKERGTRGGLEALLESLLPGAPRRFRVTDATADFGFAIVSDGAGSGSALPAMLGGGTAWSTELDYTSVLGSMRLPCADQRIDGAWQLAGKVQVEVAATARERAVWEPWFGALIAEMIPLTARLQLRWVSQSALRDGDRLDGMMILESTPDPRVGADAVTNVARLPVRGTRLSASGASISTTRLR